MWVPAFSSETSQGWRPSNLLKKAASGSLAIANCTITKMNSSLIKAVMTKDENYRNNGTHIPHSKLNPFCTLENVRNTSLQMSPCQFSHYLPEDRNNNQLITCMSSITPKPWQKRLGGVST